MRAYRTLTDCHDYSTGLMTGNDCRNFSRRSPIPVKVASAHPRSLDFKNDLADARGWIRKGCKFES
jgi:hypothetical protein